MMVEGENGDAAAGDGQDVQLRSDSRRVRSFDRPARGSLAEPFDRRSRRTRVSFPDLARSLTHFRVRNLPKRHNG